MIRIYLAAPYDIRQQARNFVAKLTQSGDIACTSRWLTDEHPLGPEAAQIDLDDIDRADILVALNPSPWHSSGTGGRHSELGYAIARQKPILLLGERSQVFHWHPLVTVSGVSGSPADAERQIRALAFRYHIGIGANEPLSTGAMHRIIEDPPLASYFSPPLSAQPCGCDLGENYVSPHCPYHQEPRDGL